MDQPFSDKKRSGRLTFWTREKKAFRISTTVAIDTSIYINECIEKQLLLFIQKYCWDLNYLSLPDLASSHHSKDSLNWMDESIMLIRNPTHQMYLKHDQLRTFGAFDSNDL